MIVGINNTKYLIKKIVYISYLPLTSKVLVDFYMQEFQNAGFEVEYLDVTSLFHILNIDKYSSSIACEINSYCELRQYFQKQNKKETLFISQITYESRCLRLYRELTKSKCLLGRFALGMVPIQSSTVTSKLKKISRNDLLAFIKNRFAILLKRWGYIKHHDIVFNAGGDGHFTIGIGSLIDMSKAEIIEINSIDYTTYQNIQSAERIVEGDYIVFLDEYFPLHSDLKILGIQSVAADRYYSELNSFFDQVEEREGKPIVIAAHPKAAKYKSKDYFNGRKTFFGQTATLVRDSNLVLAHDSTSCGFAVLFNKPITFLTSSDIENVMPQFHASFTTFSIAFGGLLLYYDRALKGELYLEPDRSKYEEYKYRFLTSIQSENRKTIDILIDFLKN